MRGLLVGLAAAVFALSLGLAPSALGKGKDEGPPAFERAFLGGYGSEDPKKRSEAVDALATAPDPDKFRLLAAHVIPKEKRADVVSHAVEILSKMKDPAACESVAKAAKTGNVDHRVIWIEALAGMTASGPAHQTALALMKDKETYVRAMAAYVLGEHRLMDSLEPLMAALEDKQWQVQAAALAAIPRLPDKAILKTKIPQLVDFLEASEGRIREDTADVLRRLTGQNLGREPAAWRAYLAGGSPEQPPKPAGDGPAGDKDKPANPYAPPPEEKPHFYGMDVLSHRVVIIMDVSLSMNEPIEIDRDRLRRETSKRRAAVTGEGPKAEKPKPGEQASEEDQGYDIPWWRIKTRLDLARYQTINLIANLKPEQSFDLILFSTKVNPWMGKLIPANQANKQKAIAMIEQIKPEAETNTWGAIAAAFELSDANVRGAGLGPDETFLVTDGAPSVGDIVDPQQILEATLQLWRVHQMRVNVIQVGVDLSFLRKMAQTTGGKWKSFK